MAELTANELTALMNSAASDERNRSPMDEFRQQDIPAIIARLNDIRDGLKGMVTNVDRIAGKVDQPPVIEEEAPPVIDDKKDEGISNPLNTISKHLLDIKEFLKKTFTKDTAPPTKLSQSTEDDPMNQLTVDGDTSTGDTKDKKVVSDTQSALGWLGSLFTIGALPILSGILGMGAAAGAGGGVLSKLLPKIIPVGKKVLRRIPIIGTLISWWDAYQKFKKGGIDNIVFGLMDVAAGFAYAFPGIGTGIGLGIDVLQYFLTNKANEWKKKTGDTSFFGSMWDTMISYLKETPIFKWMIDTGKVMKAFWDDPTYDTFWAMCDQFGSILQPIKDTFSMFNKDAGAALGLKDKEGKAQGLFTWIGDKVDEWIVTPVMGFLEGIFTSIGESILKLGKSVNKFVKRVVDNNLGDGMTKDAVYWAMGWNDKEPEGGFGEVKGLKGKARPKPTTPRMIKDVRDLAKQVGGDFGKKEYLDSLEAMSPEQLVEQNSRLRSKARRDKVGPFSPKKIPETLKLPDPHEADPWKGIETPGMSNVQNNVSQTQITNYVLDPTPSSRFSGINTSSAVA
jgi:hypothetical protein